MANSYNVRIRHMFYAIWRLYRAGDRKGRPYGIIPSFFLRLREKDALPRLVKRGVM